MLLVIKTNNQVCLNKANTTKAFKTECFHKHRILKTTLIKKNHNKTLVITLHQVQI
jgi:hypothetical protein